MNTNYDLIVMGGGFTGVAAAIAAARENAKVLLIERYGFLGGAATNSQVNPFMPYKQGAGPYKGDIVNKGIFSTILERLEELGGLHSNKCTFNEEMVKLLFDRMLKESNVDVLFHSYLIDVERSNNKIISVTVANKSGNQKLNAEYFIDSTGDADLAKLSDCSYHIGRSEDNLCQPMTLCFRLGNVDIEKFHKFWPQISKIYNEFQAKGEIKNPREDVLIFEHMSKGVIHFNSTRIVKRSPLDSFDISIAEAQAREQVYELYQFMKNNIDGFQECTLLMSAPQIGVRESRMIDGEYVITADDLINCVKFDDSIARGIYGIDIHNPDGSGTDLRGIKGDYYTIPYRALIPKGIDNLLVAGRCISSTHEAQSAYRILPICCCIGEGAGSAISVALKDNLSTKDISIEKLHSVINKYGGLY